MNFLAQNKWIFLLIGILTGWILCFIITPRKEIARIEVPTQNTERAVCVAVGHCLLDSLPILDATAVRLESNRVSDVQELINNYSFATMKSLWMINKEYKGVLESDMDPLFKKMYPRIRKQVNIEKYSGGIKSRALENSNFVAEVDLQFHP